MYADRLGSYSIDATRAGIPSLRRLKSILRYRRLARPPRWREVLRPWVLRPPDFFRPSVSDLSGSSLVSSAKSGKVAKRRPGLVGLGLRTAIRSSLPGAGVGERAALLQRLQSGEDRDLVLGSHLHDRLLPAARAPGGPAAPLGLGLDRDRADVEHLDVGEQLLDGLADLRLVRLLVHAEGVLARRREHVGLL